MFQSGIGIDVSDHHVRFARSSFSGKSLGLFEFVLPSGLIVDDLVVKPKTLNKELSRLTAEAGLASFEDNAVILIPESRVFSTSFSINRSIKGEELIAEATSLAQKDIPIPFSQAYVDVHKGIRVNDDFRVSVVVTEKPAVTNLVHAFSSMPFSLELAEFNSAALFRLYREYGKKEFMVPKITDLVMMVDIGHRWTNITLYGNGGTVIFSRSIALRKLSDTSRGVVKRISKSMIQRICKGISDALVIFEMEDIRVPLVLIAGVEGAQQDIIKHCSKIIKNCVIRRIGDIVKVDGYSAEEIHSHGAAIGAALRASKSKHFFNDHKILLRS